MINSLHAEYANPFAQYDADQEQLARMQGEIDDMHKTVCTLFECVGLLMRAENIRLDRKMGK